MREAPGAAQTQPESCTSGIPILQGAIDICNSGALVFECEPQPVPAVVQHRFDQQRSATPVDEGVSRELARRSDDLRLIDHIEPEADRGVADALPHADYIVDARDRHALMLLDVQHRGPPRPCSGSAACPVRH